MTEVVAALIEHDGRVLACRRAPGKSRGGLWEFPGGKVEAGETHPQALERELMEELGIRTRVKDCFFEQVCAYPDISIRLTVWRTQIVSGEPQALEHSEIRLCTPRELSGLSFCPADVPAVQAWLDQH